MTNKEQEKTCYTCEFLRIKDFVYGICLRTDRIVQPCNSCDKWKLREVRKSKMEDYEC